MGIIKVYTKKNNCTICYQQKTNPNLFYIKNGFSRINTFKNPDYDNIQNEGFDNFGIIQWSPRITSDDSGQFIFEIPSYNLLKGKLIIEGITSEGKLFHEEKIVDLK